MSFADILQFMREEGAVNNPTMPFLSKVMKIGPLEINNGIFSLYSDDVFIDSELILAVNDTVLLIPVGDKFVVTNKVVEA